LDVAATMTLLRRICGRDTCSIRKLLLRLTSRPTCGPDLRRAKLLGEICRVSSDEVLLFEDTSLQMPVAADNRQGQYQNFFGRPVGWYAGVCNSHGFDLVETEYLQTKVSLKAFLFLWGLLNHGRTDEGTPFSKLHIAIESRTLPITSRLDKFVHAHRGENTMMRFKKR
jgi:hypothetical protein